MRRRQYKAYFAPIELFFKKLVEDEGLLADLCLEKAIQLVQENHDAGLVGIDHFPEATGGRGPTRTDIVAAAVPLGVELYRQCLNAVLARKGDFEEAMNESIRLRDAEERGRVVTA